MLWGNRESAIGCRDISSATGIVFPEPDIGVMRFGCIVRVQELRRVRQTVDAGLAEQDPTTADYRYPEIRRIRIVEGYRIRSIYRRRSLSLGAPKRAPIPLSAADPCRTRRISGYR